MLDTLQQTNTLGPVDTIMRFFRALDEREFALLAPMLAPDGIWTRQGTDLRAADIEPAMADRSRTMRVHHLITNAYAEPGGDGEAEVCGYLLVVRHDSHVEPKGPSPLSGIDSIRTMRARLRQTAAGWRIVRLVNDAPSFVA